MTKTNQQKVKDFLINNGVIIVMFILVIYTGFTSDNFFTKNNFMNILMNMSSRLVIALGIAGCVITAGCDLSAGRMIGFGACISGMLLQRMDYSGNSSRISPASVSVDVKYPSQNPIHPRIRSVVVRKSLYSLPFRKCSPEIFS